MVCLLPTYFLFKLVIPAKMTSSDWTHSHLKFPLLNHQSSMSSLTIAFPQDNPTQLFISEASASVTIPFFNSGTASQLRICTPLRSHNFNFFQQDCLHLQSFIGALTTWSFTSRPLVLARIDAGVSLEWVCNFWESAGCFNEWSMSKNERLQYTLRSLLNVQTTSSKKTPSLV